MNNFKERGFYMIRQSTSDERWSDITSSHGVCSLPPQKCNRCGRSLGMLRYNNIHRIGLEFSAKGICDISFGIPFSLVVSERVSKLVADYSFSGITITGKQKIESVRPIKFHEEVGSRYLLEVDRTNIRVDEVASSVIRSVPSDCFECCSGLGGCKGIFLVADPKRSTLPDIFWCENFVGRLFCSSRLRDVFVEERITGLEFISAQKYRFVDELIALGEKSLWMKDLNWQYDESMSPDPKYVAAATRKRRKTDRLWEYQMPERPWG